MERTTTWIEVLPTEGAFLYADSAKMRKTAGDQVTIKSDEAGLSIKCKTPEQAQEIIEALRKNSWIEKNYVAWIIEDKDWQTWSPEKETRKPIKVPGHSAVRTRMKRQKADNLG